MRLACSAHSPRWRTAHAAKDAGFDVTLGPLFATPDEAVQLARVASVDVFGVSSLAGAHQDLVREMLVRLAEWDDAPAVVVGGIVPDARSLKDEGVFDVFGPGTPLDEVATRVVAAVDARLAATLARRRKKTQIRNSHGRRIQCGTARDTCGRRRCSDGDAAAKSVRGP